MFEFELPDLGEGVAEGELLTWHVTAGDDVEEDQVLAEVETDKAAVDVPSPVDGVVRELHYEPGEMVETGAVLISIAKDEENEAERSEPSNPKGTSSVAAGTGSATDGTSAKGGRVFAPPNVRRLARELDVAITAIDGSGPSGRITEEDVRAAAERDDPAEPPEDPEDAETADSGDERTDGDRTSEITSAVSRVDSEADQSEASEERAGAERDGDHAGDGANEPAVKAAVSEADGDADREQTLATPATRKLARDLGVDIDAVPTDEMRDGQPYVDEGAVRSYAKESEPAGTEPAAGDGVAPAETTAAGTEGGTIQESSATAEGGPASEGAADTDGPRREPYRGIRRTIGERMAQSRREVPHATHHDQAVVEGLGAARERLEPLAEDRGVRLTVTPLLVKCVAAALQDHPILNSELDAESEEIVYHDRIDIGLAVATDHGLVVPVVENVEEKGLLALAREINDLVARARDRDLAHEELQGGTFTLTNFGAIGGEYADPIINVPQTAILGTGALKERPVASGGDVVAKQTLPLSLAIDHRVIDGADAARFANTLKEYLAEPSLLLLE